MNTLSLLLIILSGSFSLSAISRGGEPEFDYPEKSTAWKMNNPQEVACDSFCKPYTGEKYQRCYHSCWRHIGELCLPEARTYGSMIEFAFNMCATDVVGFYKKGGNLVERDRAEFEAVWQREQHKQRCECNRRTIASLAEMGAIEE